MSKVKDTCIKAAHIGGDVIADYFERGTEIRHKGSSKTYDLVSDADVEAEKAVVSFLSSTFPDHAILAEEEAKGDIEAEHLWIVDPLDGTNNFAHSNPHFACSVAYYHKGKPQCGVVYNPISKQEYRAEKGLGAFLNDSPLGVSEATDFSNCLVGTGFFYDRGEMMENTLESIKTLFKSDIHGIRRLGAASLDLCYVASGIFDAYFEYKLEPWDFAAGVLILTEAGGRVSTTSGEPLGVASSSMLATNGKVHDSFIAKLSR